MDNSTGAKRILIDWFRFHFEGVCLMRDPPIILCVLNQLIVFVPCNDGIVGPAKKVSAPNEHPA